MTATSSYNPIDGVRCVAPSHARDLDVLLPHVRAVRDDAQRLAAGLSDAQFNWRPSPDRWSVAQCMKHLVLTGTAAANGQAAAIARLRQNGKLSDGPYSYRGIPSTMGNMLMNGVEPPVQKRYKTSKKVVPAAHHDRDALLAEFLGVYTRLEELAMDAKGVDLGAASVALPIPLFSMRLGQSIPFEIAHARRHLWQARQVREHADFPR